MHGSEVVILDLWNLEIVDRKIPDLEKSGIFNIIVEQVHYDERADCERLLG
jgi:hypothetical protein